jgi:hypothetical protein
MSESRQGRPRLPSEAERVMPLPPEGATPPICAVHLLALNEARPAMGLYGGVQVCIAHSGAESLYPILQARALLRQVTP